MRDMGERRIVVMLVLALMVLASMMLPQFRARLEITTVQASLLIETGPLHVRAFVSNGLPKPPSLAPSIGGIAQ